MSLSPLQSTFCQKNTCEKWLRKWCNTDMMKMYSCLLVLWLSKDKEVVNTEKLVFYCTVLYSEETIFRQLLQQHRTLCCHWLQLVTWLPDPSLTWPDIWPAWYRPGVCVSLAEQFTHYDLAPICPVVWTRQKCVCVKAKGDRPCHRQLNIKLKAYTELENLACFPFKTVFLNEEKKLWPKWLN